MKFCNSHWLELWISATAIALMTSQQSDGQELLIVSPAGLEDVEGDAAVGTQESPFRAQWLYLASDFDRIPHGGAFIIGHAERADGRRTTEVTNTNADMTIMLSTTSSDNLSENFSENIGSDATVVFEGSISITYPVSGSGGPHPFGPNVQYQTPFFYDPSMGNLLVEQISQSGSVGIGTRDAQSTDYISFLGELIGASAPKALRREVLVRQFTIPEPATVVFVLLCAGVAAATRQSTGRIP